VPVICLSELGELVAALQFLGSSVLPADLLFYGVPFISSAEDIGPLVAAVQTWPIGARTLAIACDDHSIAP
jgi:hypothetical protein